MEFEELLQYVNTELAKGNNLTQIAKGLGKNESTIRKRLNKDGYKREGNKFVLNIDTTSNITQNAIVNVDNISKSLPENTSNITSDVDIEKLNLLLSNLDSILRLIPNLDTTSNITVLKSGVNPTISLRCDSGLYKEVKRRASRDDGKIVDIVNKALEDYLNNYL